METKYSKTPFDDYTHRFIVRFSVDDDWRHDTSIDIYANDGSHDNLKLYIDEHKSQKVTHFEIIHRATKEQDECASKFIEEFIFQ
jgi:hypothetical protein